MSTWKNTLAQAAPLLGSILGGPLGVSAGQLLGKMLLGNEQATESAIEAALIHPTSAQLIALQQTDRG